MRKQTRRLNKIRICDLSNKALLDALRAYQCKAVYRCIATGDTISKWREHAYDIFPYLILDAQRRCLDLERNLTSDHDLLIFEAMLQARSY